MEVTGAPVTVIDGIITIDGSGEPEQVVTNPGRSASWSPDGHTLAYAAPDPTTANDIWLLSTENESDSEVFVRTSFDERTPRFSPDGRWLAYTSDETGQREIYVAPYPGPGRRWQISTEGGREPVWAPDGPELFYRNLTGDRMMVAELELELEFRPRRARVLFEGQYTLYSSPEGPHYDIHPDGERFVMVQDVEPEPEPIEITLNWFTELQRLAPVP